MGLKPCGCKMGSFTVLDPGQWSKTLTGSLGCCLDAIRDINTSTGQRPYAVRLVWTQWSGGSRGEGTEQVIREEMILPTPLVEKLDELDNVTTSVGSAEYGKVKVSEISVRFNEDYLMGRDSFLGEDIPDDMQFYYEVEFTGTVPYGSIKRRFEPAGTAVLNPDNVEWVINLVRAGENRLRNGTPED